MGAAYQGPTKRTTSVSTLTSPPIVLNGQHCLTFDLFLWRPLKVYTVTHRDGVRQAGPDLLDVVGSLGKGWHRIRLDVDDDQEEISTQFIFETTFGSEATYTVAMDDISLEPGVCQRLGKDTIIIMGQS